MGKGKTLYPTLTFKNTAMQVNAGKTPWISRYQGKSKKNPIRLIGDAAEEDVEVQEDQQKESEVLYPVGLPGQGVFSWVDNFLKEHPQYTELSDRMLLEWAKKSVTKQWWPKETGFDDAPNLRFTLPSLDFGRIRDTLIFLAPTLKRSFIIMSLKKNL